MHNLKEIILLTQNIRLLYVEDNMDARESTLEVLNEFFDVIITADDGQDALNKYNSQKFDLIITDINMPHINGIAMIEEIRKRDKEIPILLLSAYNEVEYFTKSIKLGVDGYLFKPIDLEQFLDVTHKIIEKINLQNKLNENLNFLKQYQDATDASAIVSKTDPLGIITHVNEKFCEISEFKKSELLGQNQNIIRHPDNDKKIFQELWDIIKNQKKTWKGIIRNMSKSGRSYYVDAMIRPILDANGEILEYIAIRHDITDVMSPRKQFIDFISFSKKPFVVEIKIENFLDIEKYYADKLAQEIEKEVGLKLVEYMPNELNFRAFFTLSDGEYSFVQDIDELSNIDEILLSLKKFQSEINNLRINIDEISYDVSILMSISYEGNVYENTKYGIESLIETKQNFIVANELSQEVHKDAQKNLNILKKVKVSLENNKIVSYFQPIVDRDGNVHKYESLVRLIDTDNSVVLPYFFLDIAKKGKYYTQITSRVLINSFKALLLTDKNISINLSAIDIEKTQIRDEIYNLLEIHKDDSSRIIFELLEDEDFKDFAVIKEFISKVKSYGVKIAIDDFGSGYSNYERLLDYQPDIIKLDGSIIKNIVTSTFSLSIVNSVILFAKDQGLDVIAEYVENKKIYEILSDLGVDYFQGYYFGKPDILSE